MLSSSMRRHGLAFGLWAILACGGEREAVPWVAQEGTCGVSDSACVLAAALDYLGDQRGGPSLLFIDTVLAHTPGVDPRPNRSSLGLRNYELARVAERLPTLRDDTRRSFIRANRPPVASAMAPPTRARLLFLRDSTSMRMYRERWKGAGIDAQLPDAAHVAYLAPAFSTDGEQALVYIDWFRAALSGTSEYFLLERTSNGAWQVVGTVVAAAS